MLTILLALTMPLVAVQKVTNTSNYQNKSSLQSQEKTPLLANCGGCGGCGPNRPPSLAELLQAVQLVLNNGILVLPQIQPLIAEQVLISNLSNPAVVQALAAVIVANGIGGPPGPQGPAGPAGATGFGISEYAYIYNLLAQSVAIEADVPFDTNGILTPGIIHAPSSTTIGIVNAGVYKVDFSVSGTQPNQFALFLNGALVPGTIYGSGAGTQQNTGQAIFTIGSGDVITLRNHSSSSAVGLASVIGGTQANVNASISILKLSP